MLKVYVDASTKGNPGPSGGGIVVTGEKIYIQEAFPLPHSTNHEAEFLAFLYALDFLKENNYHKQSILIYTDSQILSQSIDKGYAKNEKFALFLNKIHKKFKNFDLILVKWVPESQNKGADHLARQGLQKAIQLENRRK